MRRDARFYARSATRSHSSTAPESSEIDYRAFIFFVSQRRLLCSGGVDNAMDQGPALPSEYQ